MNDLEYLSNSSLFPIKVDGVSYPSVTHYVESRRFRDSNIINQIISAPNTYVVRQIVQRNIQNTYYRMIEDWLIKEPSLYEHAMKIKFRSYPSLMAVLSQTSNSNIYLPDNMGYLLEKIRDVNNQDNESQGLPPLDDIKSPDLTKIDKQIIERTILLAMHISKLKNVNFEQNQIELIQDAIYNVTYYNEGALFFVSSFLLQREWDDIYKLTNFMKLLRFVYRYILELDVSYENIVSSEIIYTIFVAINITTLLYWYRELANPSEKKDVLSYLQNPNVSISFPDISRKYNYDKQVTDKASVSGPNQSNIESITGEDAGSPEETSSISSYDEDVPLKNNESITLRPTNSTKGLNGGFEVFGTDLNLYLTVLGSLGGVYDETRNVVTFDPKVSKNAKSVANYIFSRLSEQQKYEMAYNDWLFKRILNVVDIASIIAEFSKSKDINYNHIRATLVDMYSYVLPEDVLSEESGQTVYSPTGLEYEEVIEQIMNSSDSLKSFVLTIDAKTLVIKWINYISKNILKNIKHGDNKSYRQYIFRINKFTNWLVGSTKHFLSSTQNEFPQYNENQICILRAIVHIYTTLCHYKYKNNSEEEVIDDSMFIEVGKILVLPRNRNNLENLLYRKDKFNYKTDDLRKILTLFVTKYGSITHNLLTPKALLYIDGILHYITMKLRNNNKYKTRIRLLANLSPKTTESKTIDSIVEEADYEAKEDLISDPVVDMSIKDFVPNLNIEKIPLHDALLRSNYIALLIASTCDSVPSGDPIVDDNFLKHPYINVYNNNTNNGFKLGDVMKKIPLDDSGKPEPPNSSHPYFMLLVTSLNPGPPHKILDREENRHKWIETALDKLDEHAKKSNNVTVVSFYERQIRDEYKQAFYDFSKRTGIKIYLIKDDVIPTNIQETTNSININSNDGNLDLGQGKSQVGPEQSDLSISDADSVGEKSVGTDSVGSASVDSNESNIQASNETIRLIFDKHTNHMQNSQLKERLYDMVKKMDKEKAVDMMNKWADIRENERTERILSDVLFH